MENQEYKKMVLLLDGGIVGTNTAEFYLVHKDTSQEDLDADGWQLAVDWAANFGVYPECDRPEDEDDEDDENYDSGEYSDDICYTWEEYNPDKHDMLRVSNDDSWRKYN